MEPDKKCNNMVLPAKTLFFHFRRDVGKETVIAVDEIMLFHVRRGFILKLSSEILFNMEPGL